MAMSQDFWLDFVWKQFDEGKRRKKGFDLFLQKDRAQIRVSASVPSLVVSAYEQMSVTVLLLLNVTIVLIVYIIVMLPFKFM